jgi:hypothetical protein
MAAKRSAGIYFQYVSAMFSTAISMLADLHSGQRQQQQQYKRQLLYDMNRCNNAIPPGYTEIHKNLFNKLNTSI